MVKKKVLVIGATGMLGHMVYRYLYETASYDLFNSVYRTKLTEDSIICDVTNEGALVGLFNKTNPNVVVNCVGALISQSNENPEAAIYLNALLPHKLKRLCDRQNAKLIHVSTDCVFSGNKGNYAEDDYRDADDVYGRSKALGEIDEAPHCTLRTSIIGPELKKNGTGLFHWFMNQTGHIPGFSKAIWGGVTTLELAKVIEKAIKEDFSGIIQVTNGMSISKFDLLNLFAETFLKQNTKVVQDDSYIVNKSLLPSAKVNLDIVDYPDMIKVLLQYMQENREIYNQYL